MKELYTEIEINASAADVWRLITDLEGYESWNPFIIKATGTPAPGAVLSIRMQPPGAKAMDYKLTTITFQLEREFSWLGKMFAKGILDGEHIFQIEPLAENCTRLVHREYFRGILVPLVWWCFLNTKLRRGFELMNTSLKATAEQQRVS